MESTPATDGKIAPLYRFALLLTANPAAAEQTVVELCEECAPQIGGFRNQNDQLAFMVKRLRSRCSKRSSLGRAPAAECPEVAKQIQALPEPERSVTALFYLQLFPAHEIAAIFKMSLEQLSETLARGRSQLRALEPVA